MFIHNSDTDSYTNIFQADHSRTQVTYLIINVLKYILMFKTSRYYI